MAGVTLPDQDVMARARSIFERLRAEQQAPPGEAPTAGGDDPTGLDGMVSTDEIVETTGPPGVGADVEEAQPEDRTPAEGAAGTAGTGERPGGEAVEAQAGPVVPPADGERPRSGVDSPPSTATVAGDPTTLSSAPAGPRAAHGAPGDVPPGTADPTGDSTASGGGQLAPPATDPGGWRGAGQPGERDLPAPDETAAGSPGAGAPPVPVAPPATEPDVPVERAEAPVLQPVEARDQASAQAGTVTSAPDVAFGDAAAPPATAPVTPEDTPGAGSAGEAPGQPSPRVMAIANQKGGVGKTTTAVNLGAALAELGLRVLVVDLDPQGNATTGLGINSRNLDQSIYDVLLRDVALDDCIEPTSLRNLFVAPATIELAGAEIELVPAFSRELRLRRAIDEVRDDFDFVLIDCPPSLGLLTVNGLAAADEVLVPIQCEYYALEGLGQLLRNVNLVQANLNPRLEVSTIVLTMYDARTKLAEQVTREVRRHFGAKVCRNVVPRTVRLSEAPSFGQPVTLFDPTSRGSIAYRELAKEVHRGPSERAR